VDARRAVHGMIVLRHGRGGGVRFRVAVGCVLRPPIVDVVVVGNGVGVRVGGLGFGVAVSRVVEIVAGVAVTEGGVRPGQGARRRVREIVMAVVVTRFSVMFSL